MFLCFFFLREYSHGPGLELQGDPAVVVGNNLQGRPHWLVLNYITNFSIQIARIPFHGRSYRTFHRWPGGFLSSCLEAALLSSIS